MLYCLLLDTEGGFIPQPLKTYNKFRFYFLVYITRNEYEKYSYIYLIFEISSDYNYDFILINYVLLKTDMRFYMQ